MTVTNIIIGGVGGQGLVLATDIISHVAFKEGFDIKSNDVIGLSQRGGMVWGSLRFGEKVHSALIPSGEGDILLALEELEALRWTKELKKGATIIVNKEIIYPNKVLIEKADYPENIKETLENLGFNVMYIDAKNLCKSLGNTKVSNTVLLGKLSTILPFRKESWIEVIKEKVPKSTIELNIKAFELGSN